MLLTPRPEAPIDALARPERLNAVAALLPDTRDSTVALQQFVDHVAAVLHAPCAAVSLILNDAGILAATHGVGGWLAEAGGMPTNWAPCATVVRHNAPMLLTDTHDDPAHTGNPLVMITGIRSYAGVPLHFRGQPVGSVCVLAGEPGRFTQADLGTLLELEPRAVRLLHDAARP